MKVSALVPVYNEAATVGAVLHKLCGLDFVDEIVVIDDHSDDGSLEVIRSVHSPKLRVSRLPSNSGKTAAIAKAIELATGDILAIQDADLEYDPEELALVVDPIKNGVADVVYGSRFLVRRAARVLYFHHYVANRVLTLLSNILTNLNMTDIETCYKAFRAPILKEIKLTSSGFGMEVELTALISKMPLRVYEVPISYYGRTYEEGKKIRFRDGVAAFCYLPYFNLIQARLPWRKRYFERVMAALAGTVPPPSEPTRSEPRFG
jgi:glycosyltransferase involved in cell wall biosynthesis